MNEPHTGLEVTKWYDGPGSYASINGHLVRYYDLICIGCKTEWKHVAPTAHRSTVLCDECAALNEACDRYVQAFWDAAIAQARQERTEPKLPFCVHPNGNRGVYAMRDLLFDHAVGRRALERWTAQRWTRLGVKVPEFGSKKL